MPKYLTPFLVYSSIPAMLFLFSCTSPRHAGTSSAGRVPDSLTTHLVPFPESSVYRTNIMIRDHRISGLMIFKQTAPEIWRIVFVNEIGMKFFDFRLSGNNFEVVECYKYLRRKKMLSVFEEDFRSMLIRPVHPEMLHAGNENSEAVLILDRTEKRHKQRLYYLNKSTLLPEKTELYRKRKKISIVQYDNYKRNRPDTFVVTHRDIKLEIHFKLLDH